MNVKRQSHSSHFHPEIGKGFIKANSQISFKTLRAIYGIHDKTINGRSSSGLYLFSLECKKTCGKKKEISLNYQWYKLTENIFLIVYSCTLQLKGTTKISTQY